MPDPKSIESVARRIIAALEQAQTAGEVLVHYIESTFGSLSPETVAAAVADDTNPEQEPLLDLLFFPDAVLQEQIEDDLEAALLQPADEPALADLLASRPPTLSLLLPNSKAAMRIRMPERAAGDLIKRLRVSRRIPGRLKSAVAAHMGPSDGRRCKVELRNARLVFNDVNTSFLVQLFTRMPAHQSGFWDCLKFALDFLETTEGESDLWSALLKRKKRLVRHLRQAEQQSEHLQRSNMETLLQQGFRMPHIDIQETRRKIAWCDRLAVQVYDAPLPDSPPARSETREFDPSAGPPGLFDAHLNGSRFLK